MIKIEVQKAFSELLSNWKKYDNGVWFNGKPPYKPDLRACISQVEAKLEELFPAKCLYHPAYDASKKPRKTKKYPEGCSICWKVFNNKNEV